MQDEKAKLRLRERVIVQRWDHDCPAMHGGKCTPETVILEWCDGVPVEPGNFDWEREENAAANNRT